MLASGCGHVAVASPRPLAPGPQGVMLCYFYYFTQIAATNYYYYFAQTTTRLVGRAMLQHVCGCGSADGQWLIAGTERLLLFYMDQMVMGLLYYTDGRAMLQHIGMEGDAGRY